MNRQIFFDENRCLNVNPWNPSLMCFRFMGFNICCHRGWTFHHCWLIRDRHFVFLDKNILLNYEIWIIDLQLKVLKRNKLMNCLFCKIVSCGLVSSTTFLTRVAVHHLAKQWSWQWVLKDIWYFEFTFEKKQQQKILKSTKLRWQKCCL